MIIQADILQWAEEYDGPLFHAVLCDCPYEMEFMGRDWDNSGISFNPETWKAIARHLHPGAFLFVMAGTINDDMISVAMRQAGLRKYHKAVYWSYGSGFPKAARIDTVIDRRAGAERRVVGRRRHQPKFDAAGFEYRKKDNGYNSKGRESFDVTEPATDLAAAWAGHRYGGQVLKPSAETVLIFQKPYQGRPVDCITKTGAGALNVDGGRVGTHNYTQDEWSQKGASRPTGTVYGAHRGSETELPAGRWPANLLLSHTPACRAVGSRRVKGSNGINYIGEGGQFATDIYGNSNGRTAETPRGYGEETITVWQCAEGCPVQQLDRQSGVSESARRKPTGRDERGEPQDLDWRMQRADTYERGHTDSGGASRFFHQSHWAYEIEERIAAADPVRYCAKASKAEREGGLDPLQIKLIGALDAFDETTVDDGRQTPIDNPYQRGETKRRNTHPCIKPLSLTSYLARLLSPPVEYAPRRILIPFSGTGSEYLGALLSGGWDEIVGVEISEEYVRIAEARIAFWKAIRHRFADPDSEIRVSINGDRTEEQLTLF